MHIAYHRCAQSAGGSDDTESFILPVKCVGEVDDAASILTATSIRMSLAIMQCLQPSRMYFSCIILRVMNSFRYFFIRRDV